jgi:hypothetical protein
MSPSSGLIQRQFPPFAQIRAIHPSLTRRHEPALPEVSGGGTQLTGNRRSRASTQSGGGPGVIAEGARQNRFPTEETVNHTIRDRHRHDERRGLRQRQ